MNIFRRFFITKNSIGLIAIWVFLAHCTNTYSQGARPASSPHIWFDNSVGQENSSLYNGILFVDVFNVINDEHRFFDSPDFMVGHITYDGQIYYNQQLKYDLYGDEILVNPIGTSKALVIQLRKSKTEEFILNEQRFINVAKTTNGVLPIDLGFCEVISEKNTALLLKKHIKKIEEKKNKEFKYQEFNNDNGYYIIFDETYYSVNTQREWLSLFPDSKKEIKSFYKGYNALRKSNTAAFQKLLFQRFLDTNAIQK